MSCFHQSHGASRHIWYETVPIKRARVHHADHLAEEHTATGHNSPAFNHVVLQYKPFQRSEIGDTLASTAFDLLRAQSRHPLYTVLFAEALHAPPPRVVFENALTESGFLGLARDLDLLALPFATHTGLVSLFRQYASNLPKR